MHRNDSSVGGVEIVVGGAARESDECGGGAACGVEAWEHGGTESRAGHDGGNILLLILCVHMS